MPGIIFTGIFVQSGSPLFFSGVLLFIYPFMSKSASPRSVAAEWFRRLWLEHDGSVMAELMTPDARGELEGGVVTRGPEEFAFLREGSPGS